MGNDSFEAVFVAHFAAVIPVRTAWTRTYGDVDTHSESKFAIVVHCSK